MGAVQNQVVIITGAGAGLGRETALLLAQAGANIAACDLSTAKVKRLQSELYALQKNAYVAVADISHEAVADHFVQETIARFGRIDVLINNAALYENYLLAETSKESWDYQFINNVNSVFFMTKACIPVMREQKHGQIISLTSSLAKTGGVGFGSYSASKAAIETLTYTVQEEEAQNGITANVLNPGVMRTDMQTTGTDPSIVARKLVQWLQEYEQKSGQVVAL
ncbi:SDR family oxidoreductase [Brevibacillus humidisoli]|uniref:SDR family NAD(P)-dependent oxidoreductase n=1 Tax=Brevibacillus humidisoli TaxID=2895522 RepID=UPI001E2E1C38|nr:SDR family oxidoreductase [Brevibacillus humidisoli]UFJ41040.1 SDR family oxidoreductase [Brevibacillus humidisoli]